MVAQEEIPARSGPIAVEPGRPQRVGAVIVTYFPRPDSLQALLDAVASQVERLVLVDNTPAAHAGPDLSRFASERCDVIRNGDNLGLAAAQNLGIGRARERGCDHVLLLDQDSLPAPGMVDRLCSALRRLQSSGVRVAAVGPRWNDRHSGRDAPFVRIGVGRMHKVHCDDRSREPVACDTLVASGCLIPVASYDAIGPMDERLFIDQVDVEWGLRAQALGYRLFGVCDAVLQHGIGEAAVPVWFARGRRVPVHSPVRDYYLVRNTITVFFRRPAPWRWRLLSAVRLPALLLVMLTQMPQRRRRLRYIARAIIDALRGRLGPLPVAATSARL
jgi:rhamnosyltransferase